jgi:hypothetical protein
LKWRSITLILMCVLTVLSIMQIASDYLYEEKLGESTSSLAKQPVYSIFIEIEDKTLYLLENGKCIKEYTIASGKSGLPSPLGCWKIIDKGDWGEGFGGRWMGLDVPWGTYGIHGTLLDDTIGSAASHGCIRMFSDDIAELYGIVPLGTEVTIANGIFGPFGRGFSEINSGDRGADVLAIQYRLRQLGYYKGEFDGVYEDDLKKALHKFQRDNKLEVNNTIDRQCWHKMGFREFE